MPQDANGNKLKCYESWFCRIFCPRPFLDRCAFRPPYPCDYEFHKNQDTNEFELKLSSNARFGLGIGKFLNLDLFYVTTTRKNSVACLYVHFVRKPKFVFLHSHGNAEDLGESCHLSFALATLLDCNVMSYDYSGFGISTGRPSETNVYCDIEAVYDVMMRKYDLEPSQVILIGQSLGTVSSHHTPCSHSCRLKRGHSNQFPHVPGQGCLSQTEVHVL